MEWTRASAIHTPILLLLLSIELTAPIALLMQAVEVDVTALAYKVIDGDTFDAFSMGRVRLADVDAPELGELGGKEAKDALAELILEVKAYLDVDDLYVMDKYNRLVCVVYIRHNSTHLLNVNKWLVDEGYVKIVDHPNEFDPYEWALYAYYPIELEEFVSKAEYDKLKSAYEETSRAFDILHLDYKRVESSLMAALAYGAFVTIALFDGRLDGRTKEVGCEGALEGSIGLRVEGRTSHDLRDGCIEAGQR